MKHSLAILAVMCFCTLPVKAQWTAGLSGGLDYNTPKVNNGYASDMHYVGRGGWNFGLVGRYQFIDWLAVRADLRLSTRNYRMERHMPAVSEIYTEHNDLYIHLPVAADFSFGGKKIRGHFYAGGYIGCWLAAHRKGMAISVDLSHPDGIGQTIFDESMDFDNTRDQRFNAGLTAGAGISFAIAAHWEILTECFYLYDLTSSNKTNMVSNPRYNKTIDFNLGIMYNF